MPVATVEFLLPEQVSAGANGGALSARDSPRFLPHRAAIAATLPVNPCQGIPSGPARETRHASREILRGGPGTPVADAREIRRSEADPETRRIHPLWETEIVRAQAD